MSAPRIPSTVLARAIDASQAWLSVTSPSTIRTAMRSSTSSLVDDVVLVIGNEAILRSGRHGLPGDGGIEVQRAFRGDVSQHAIGQRVYILKREQLRTHADGRLGLVGDSGALPPYWLPLGSKEVDQDGRPLLLCDFTESVSPGDVVSISADGLYTAGKMSTTSTSAFAGAIGVVAETSDTDEWGWVRVFDDVFGGEITFNVRQWGASTTATAAVNHAAIQAAIDAAYAVTGNAANVTADVYIPRGAYNISSGLTARNVNGPGGSGCATRIRGAGKGNTTLILANGANTPVLTLGGTNVANLTTWLTVMDLSLECNGDHQTGNQDGILALRLDRSAIERVTVSNPKRNGLRIVGSAAAIDGLEVFGSLGDAVVVDACHTLSFENCYLNDNEGYGAVVQFTNADLTGGVAVGFASNMFVTFRNNHFEHNVLGEIHLDGVENTGIIDNNINPFANPACLVDGIAIANLFLHNRFQIGGIDATTLPTGRSCADYNCVVFGTHTVRNIHGFNTVYHEIDYPETLQNQFLDLGSNISWEADDIRPHEIDGVAGGDRHAGWTAIGTTNYCLWSEDLTNAAWVKVNVDSVTQASGARNPWSNAGTGDDGKASSVEFHPTSGDPAPICTITQTIAGLSIVAGDEVTFSVESAIPSWTAGQSNDFHLRILTTGNAVLADTAFRTRARWTRKITSFISTATYSSLKVQIYKVTRSSSSDCFWGAQFNIGPFGAYIPTTAAAVTVNPGCYPMRVAATKALQIGANGMELTSWIAENATLNTGALPAGNAAGFAVTVTGAALGDQAFCAHFAMPTQATIHANVTAADTVTVIITNIAGFDQTINGTARVSVMKSHNSGA